MIAYNEWREDRFCRFQYDVGIYEADLNNLEKLIRENFSHVLCKFILKVTKQKGMGPYPGRTLNQIIKDIQRHLNIYK